MKRNLSIGASACTLANHAYDAGDNMTSKTEPWVDDFSDGVVTDDGLGANGTWSVVNGAAQNAWTTTLTSVAINYGVTTTMGVKYKVRVEAVGDRVRVWRSPAAGGAEVLVFDQTGMPTLDGDTVRFQAGAGTVNSYDDLMVLADDAGLSRTTTMTYRANNEIATTDDYNGTTNYTFDAWGRMDTEAKNGTTKTYSWTSANLLAGMTSSNSADTNVSYTYGGDLKGLWRFENSTLTNWYQWDAGFNVLNEFSNVNPMKTFVPGVAEVSGNTLATTADYHYLTTDHLGSTRGMWNQSAAAMGAWEFTPYGSPYNFAGPGDVTQLYTGHDLDRVTGQYYAPFRFLNPGLGRWINADPFGMIDGTNEFQYALDDPVDFIDLEGSHITADNNDAWKAMWYLAKDPTFRQVFKTLWQSPTEFVIRSNSDCRFQFLSGPNVIEWDPSCAHRYPLDHNATSSPAIALAHEMGHAAFDPLQRHEGFLTPDAQYGNKEDRRVITTIETPIAITLGEGTRTNHDGGDVHRVSSPITRPRFRN